MCAKVWSKKYYLVKQGLYKLKANKKKKSRLAKVKTAYIVEVGSFDIPNPHSSLLADFFIPNFSFLILPDVISDNIPVLFYKVF